MVVNNICIWKRVQVDDRNVESVGKDRSSQQRQLPLECDAFTQCDELSQQTRLDPNL